MTQGDLESIRDFKRCGDLLRREVVICFAVGVVVITTTQLNSTKPELRFCAG